MPVSEHPIDSVNLKDPRLGIYAQLAEFVRETGVAKGRLRVTLDPTERHSALTVNEYETLLMRYDLAEVLRNPLRFVAEKSRHALANPRAVPSEDAGLREVRHGARAQQGPRRARSRAGPSSRR